MPPTVCGVETGDRAEMSACKTWAVGISMWVPPEMAERAFKTDWNVRATGLYAEGRPLYHAGSVVIACRTPSGTLEFAVPRPDVQLVLHVLQRAGRAGAA
jgi:hypothetical protein